MPLIPLSALIDVYQAQVGVVPVVAQAGTALFPLIVLAVTSTIGLLLKPRELLRMFRKKPWIPVLLAALGLGGWWMVRWLTTPSDAPTTSSRTLPTSAPSAGPRTDWARVALALIEQEAAAKIHPALPAPDLIAPAVTTTLISAPSGITPPVVGLQPAETSGARFFAATPDAQAILVAPHRAA
jgi:hypothetical protein